MQQPEKRKRSHAPVVNRRRLARSLFLPARHQHDARAEQYRENGHELLVGEDMAHEPHPVVRPLQIAVRRRICIGRLDHGETLNVHHENAEQRETAEHVDRLDAVRLLHCAGPRRIYRLHRNYADFLRRAGHELSLLDRNHVQRLYVLHRMVSSKSGRTLYGGANDDDSASSIAQQRQIP